MRKRKSFFWQMVGGAILLVALAIFWPIKSDNTSLMFLPSLAQAALNEFRNSSGTEVLTTANFCFSLNVPTKHYF